MSSVYMYVDGGFWHSAQWSEEGTRASEVWLCFILNILL